jgi:hypothetical protein
LLQRKEDALFDDEVGWRPGIWCLETLHRVPKPLVLGVMHVSEGNTSEGETSPERTTDVAT